MNTKVNYVYLTLSRQKNGRMPKGKNRAINLYRITRTGLKWQGVQYVSTHTWRGAYSEAVQFANKLNGNRLSECGMHFKSKNHTMVELQFLY